MRQRLVLKIGGSLKGQAMDAVSAALAAAEAANLDVVIVHGGGPAITEALQQRGIELPFIDGQRMTTPAAMGVVEAVLYGQVNQAIVQHLRATGKPAQAMAGWSGILLAGGLPNLQRSGRVERVNPKPLEDVLARGEIPVVCPIGVDESGVRYNINADLAASAVAAALQANKIVFFTDVPGIYSDFANRIRMEDVTATDVRALAEEGRFQAGMLPKVNAVLQALAGGVAHAYVIQGNDVSTAVAAVQHTTAPWRQPLGTHIAPKEEERWV
ncbi:acetylglutamate kinase [Alicyclobacillus contaminans]|uniref:acetylglutamate kinase n=1 Tax=Alicyclobacillus contaminans TaxID=392016 RepID=UPI000684D25A|nr:acetylglutamate kinase [Alicyclobacillus contaminans]